MRTPTRWWSCGRSRAARCAPRGRRGARGAGARAAPCVQSTRCYRPAPVAEDPWAFARVERDRHFPQLLPGGYRCRAVDPETYWEAYERDLREFFADEVYFSADPLREPASRAAHAVLQDVLDAVMLKDNWLVDA